MHHRKHVIFGTYPLGKLIITCPSQWLQKRLQTSYLGHYPIHVIPNGIDTTCFTPPKNKSLQRQRYGLPVDKKIILFSAANLRDTSKGSAFIPLLAKALSDKPYMFLSIGESGLSDAPNIRNTGYIKDRQQLADLIGTADIFCFLSSLETFSLATAEALACGVPVVGFDIPVIREMVTSDVGTLTPHGDIDTLCRSINHALSASNSLTEMCLAARQRIITHYDERLFIERYRQVYDLLLQDPYQ
jgi:glycosyltransferase involved in cell wall biosynthesis